MTGFLVQGGAWVQTSITNRIRGVFAGVGYTYDPLSDVFVPPIPDRPYARWTFNKKLRVWLPPAPLVNSEVRQKWDEETLTWVAAE